ncbi:histidine kinase [Parabacteroides sp. 52]|uniref:sensor histidine kinase n=2 Tax=unclassified Parabacteroides TaxID=2649774 RepID=UPI0013D1FF48|nr:MULTISPECIES: histidine kinase [unclassified Parabacteroides]NDV56086.1 histidine kinase [Parabacteroides sp. 52]
MTNFNERMTKLSTISRPHKLCLISLLCALFVLYPEITWIPFELKYVPEANRGRYITFFIFRALYYAGVTFFLLRFNLLKIKTPSFKKRFGYNFLISLATFICYGVISFLTYSKVRHFGSLILFQFFLMCILSTVMGYIYWLFEEQRKKEQEIERLKLENLQSQYDALTNQINPHFFFNSLNGLTSLIRKKDDETTLTYVNKLSDVFRYILQSDKKGLVTLGEELEFVDAFRYMMEVRFANKLEYRMKVEKEMLSYKIPVLSILPLLDNIVVHNMIDSDHKMEVSITVNAAKELVVSNPVYPKIAPSVTNGTGLRNLENRYALLMNKQIRIADDGVTFRVYLPLK